MESMDKDINLFVSIKLNEFIEKNNISIEDIMEKTGYKRPYIKKVLNYKNNHEKPIKIWFKFMVFFAEAYNVNVKDFLP